MKTPFRYLALTLLGCTFALGQQFKVLHSFKGYPTDGTHSVADIVFDSTGNLYGTTPGGGNSTAPPCSGLGSDSGCGAVFELSPDGKGGWTESVIYSFCSDFKEQSCADGAFPDAGLVVDAKGNLYGTTSQGGISECPTFGTAGCGTVFELSPPAAPSGTWTQTVLYNFCSNTSGGQCFDGETPWSQLIFDSVGSLYGTTAGGGSGHYGGNLGGGTVFKLSPSSSGWTETVLYNFCSLGQGNFCPDGNGPEAGVNFDASGNLYGTTIIGGYANSVGGGVMYRLSPQSGTWQENVVLRFGSNASDQGNSESSITIDPKGILYGVYSFPNGGVFRYDPVTKKAAQFVFNGEDGQGPNGGVYIDPKSGAVYGTTTGFAVGPGNVFKIAANGKETVLHTFCSWPACNDGEISWSQLVPDNSGNLYGTTEFGGVYGGGVVFEITP